MVQSNRQAGAKNDKCSARKKGLDGNLNLSSDGHGEFIRAKAQFQILIQALERFGSRESGGENQNGQSA
jgi:hypothetical protein